MPDSPPKNSAPAVATKPTGNQIPDSYLKRFLPSQGYVDDGVEELPADLGNFVELL